MSQNLSRGNDTLDHGALRRRFVGGRRPFHQNRLANATAIVPQPSWSPNTTQQLRKLVAAPYLPPNDWTPRLDAYFVFPLAQGTPGKQRGLAATGNYQPSLRSPWLTVKEKIYDLPGLDIYQQSTVMEEINR